MLNENIKFSSITSIQGLSSPKLLLVSVLVFIGFWLSSAIVYRNNYYENKPYPKNTFLCSGNDQFSGCPAVDGYHCYGDLQATLIQNQSFNPYIAEKIYRSNYFPLAHVLTLPLSWLSPGQSTYLFLALAIGIWFWTVFSVLECFDLFQRWMGSLVLSGLSYPFLLSLDRGNIEVFLAPGILIFWKLYKSGNRIRAAVFLGVLSSFKPFPAFLGILFLRGRFWKESRAALLSGIGTCLVSFLIISEDSLISTIRSFFMSLGAYIGYVQGFRHIEHVTNIQAFFAQIAITLKNSQFHRLLVEFNRIGASFISLVFFLGTLIICFRTKVEEWRVLGALIVAPMLYLSGSGGYRLVSLILVLGGWLSSSSDNMRKLSRWDWGFLICFVAVWIPKVGGDLEVLVATPALAILLGLLLWPGRLDKSSEQYRGMVTR
ncbi:MAG: DUF2029 domain-containing protein [Deltaproteobacteria bacterium]|nr:DUF2029 domain-containing protein [Deltaproteobacteria bacterium]